ncbi:DNA alkylation repair enzyme [hydrothermal vent metagenome]|uniref:DNA alkylation repair enzyme n=1 Tax=hydrothermal vent metagenome TaxID=652676 RepID=A0A3B0RZ82_9ZZZZ
MEPFKNWFSPQLVKCISGHLQKHLQGFDRSGFETAILSQLDALELKQRSQLIADTVHLALPQSPDERYRILSAMLHPDEEDHANQPSNEQGICGWGIMPLAEVVGQHNTDDFERSMELLRQMTKRSSSEFAIRYFLLADQSRALKIIKSWVSDPNRHVRRLVSEGTRPRLPWAMQLPQLITDPSPMLPILRALRNDDEEYVTRSVANHLNDIAKDHPDRVASLALEWMKGADKAREKLVRHACRTLIKQGHKTALKAFGIGPPRLELEVLKIDTPTVNFGDALEFSAQLRSTGKNTQSLIIDYLIHFKKANGTLAAKVFKWTKLTLEPGETRTLTKKHPIRPITTRRYYAGQQGLSLRINGQDFGDAQFELTMPDQD